MNISGVHCLIVGVFAYTRNPDAVWGQADAVNNTLVRYDDTVFITHVPESTTTGYAWVIMAVILPMGWHGSLPASEVYADISLIQIIGG